MYMHASRHDCHLDSINTDRFWFVDTFDQSQISLQHDNPCYDMNELFHMNRHVQSVGVWGLRGGWVGGWVGGLGGGWMGGWVEEVYILTYAHRKETQ